MSNKFLHTTADDGDISSGNLTLYGASLGAVNLNPSQAVKTNSLKQLVSTNLDISDINNLQNSLDNAATDGINVGAGQGLFKQKNGTNLEFKTISSTNGNITINTVGDEVQLTGVSGGAVNPNVGFSATPVQAGFTNVGVNGTAVSGRYLFLQGGSTTVAYSYKEPTAPVILDTFNHSATVNKIKIFGSYAFCFQSAFSGTGQGIRILNISNPDNITSVAQFGTTINITNCILHGRYVYAIWNTSATGQGDIKLRVYEFLGDEVIQLGSDIDILTGQSCGNSGAEINNDILYVLTNQVPGKVYTSNISSPSLPGTFGLLATMPAQCKDMKLQENTLFFGANQNIYKMDLEKSPILVDDLQLPVPLYELSEIHMYGDYMFAIEDGWADSPQSGGIYMYNVNTMTEVQRFESDDRNKVGFILQNYIGIVKLTGGEVRTHLINSRQIDFLSCQGLETAQVNVRTDAKIAGGLNVIGNTNLGGGLFVSKDSTFGGSLSISNNNFIRGCIRTSCIEAEGGIGTIDIKNNASITGNLTVSGDLTINGTQTTLNVETVVIDDPLLVLGKDNPTDTSNLGLILEYNNTYSGLIRYHSNGEFYLYNSSTLPTTTTDMTGPSGGILNLSNLNATQLNGTTADINTVIVNTDFKYNIDFFEVYVDNNTNFTTITTIDVWEKVNFGSTISYGAGTGFITTVDGKITYNGSRARHCHVSATISAQTDTKDESVEFCIFRNGVYQNGTVIGIHTSNDNRYQSGTITAIGPKMNNGDYLEIYCRNESSTANITVNHLNFSGECISNE